jgi:tetratricopeptide (TPR) repeat protein
MADKSTVMKEAQKYLAKGQIDKAISELEKLIKEAPEGNTHNTIGDLYLKKGDKNNAVESYHKAANFFRHEGFSLKALALYKKILNINPTDAGALYSLGELSEEKGIVTDAIKYYLATADSYIKEGKKDKVLEIYQKILSLSPSNIPLRTKVAEIFLKEGLKTDASKEYIHIAGIYEDKGDFANSKQYYQKVLDLQPLNKDAVLGLSHLFEKAGEIDSAVEHMKEANALFPEDPDVILRCVDLLLIKNDSEGAKSYLQRIVDKDPENMKSRRLLGGIYLKEGQQDKAWDQYVPVLDAMIVEEQYKDAIGILETFRETDPVEVGKRLISIYRQRGEENLVASELISLGDILVARSKNDDALIFYNDALSITPDDELLREKIDSLTRKPEEEIIQWTEGEEQPLAEEQPQKEHISIKAEKSVEDIFTEADIFARYGLLGESRRLLEELSSRDPDNMDVHSRLKNIYIEMSNMDLAVTECIALSELYRRSGDTDSADRVLQEAYEINPEDERLTEKAEESLVEPTSFAPEVEEITEIVTGEPKLEDYQEEISEADFYAKQGLTQEALKVLEKLHGLFPDNGEIREKLLALGKTEEISESPELPEVEEAPEEIIELPEVGAPESVEIDMPEVKEAEEEIGKVTENEFENFVLTDEDLEEAQEMPEPKLDDDVLEIFDEFKKGLEKELGDEDSETHYNLGIAYKEMGLIDDAIKEFQTSRNDPKRFVQSSTMLGVCYVEKGLYSLAIDALKNLLKDFDANDESYWAIKYDLAEAYEKNNDLREALELYTEVYGRDAKFREVDEKLASIKSRIPSIEEKKVRERKDRVSYL